MSVKFVDEVVIQVSSGHGGAGCVAFRREKYIPYGGPSGGDGGRGGHVLVRVDPQMATLLDYRFRPKQAARAGGAGAGAQCHGADGGDLVLPVPPGTMVYRKDSGDVLADLSEEGDSLILARGGRGGKGNEHFKTSVRQAPQFAQPGEPGESLEVRLELKLLADVGLVGYPNVGKSSLIARVSACRPKIADYPFTTLVPNLGVVRLGGWTDLVVADVPGLVAGAHAGVGLGSRFLRHLERVRVLVHLFTAEVGIEGRSPEADIAAIDSELAKHSDTLAKVPQVWALNRIDMPEVAELIPTLEAAARARNIPFFPISAVTGAGVKPLLAHLATAVQRLRPQPPPRSPAPPEEAWQTAS